MRVGSLNKELYAYDHKLFAQAVTVNRRRPDYDPSVHKSPNEVVEQVHIKRKSTAYDTYWLDENTPLVASRKSDDFILALTKDWTTKSDPVEWGVLPILEKLKEMDRWNRGGVDLFEEMDKHNQKIDQSQARATSNLTEEWAREMHSGFKKATSDINVASLSDPRMKTLKTRSY